MIRSFSAVLALLALVGPRAAVAHEFWIEPHAASVPAQAAIVADLRVGQDFAGMAFPYLSHRFVRFWLRDARGERPVEGGEGDIPAIRIDRTAPGVTAIAYHSTADQVVFDTWPEFLDYIDYEGNGWAAAAHRASGRPETGISERYVRCAKALVRVGESAAWTGDPGIGLPLELIALSDPFAASRGVLRVRLVWMDRPAADTQIAVFERGAQVTRSVIRTGPDGEADIPLTPGRGYLLSAVRLALMPDGADVDWESHWASLTFETGRE